ncbi:MAG: hypothetical protein ACU0CI_07330 [Shimia sp.]
MSASLLITLCCIGIIAILLGRAIYVVRSEDTSTRGSLPGTGSHKLRSDYQSGVGGGHVTEWEIPRDPQAYAKHLIPLKAKPADKTGDAHDR